MGVYESSPTSVTDGDLGTVGITSGRRLKTSATIDAALPAGTNNIGDVDVLSSALPSGAATSANQTNGTQLTQIVDAGGDAVTVTGGKLDVNATISGGSGGTSSIDDAAFTAASDSGTPMMGFASADTVDSGDVGVLAMDTSRNLKVIAQSNSGVDIGDVTINNPAGASAVNIQDGGNTITVDYATTGSGTATGALRVELPTNGTGTVGLNAGTNAIGKLAANSGVDIGDVDILSIAAGDNNIGNVDIVTVPADPFGANADAAATAGGTGSIQAKLRNLTSTNDAIKTAVETLDNAISGSEMQVDVVAALPAGTNAIGKLAANTGVDIGDVDVTSVVPGTGASNLGKAEDAGHTTGDVGVMALGVRTDAQAALATTTADYIPMTTDSVGAQYVTLSASTGAIGASMYWNSGLTSTKQAVNASGGNLYGYHLYNPNTSVAYVQFFNVASASVTVGTTAPNMVIAIPPQGWADSPTTGPGIGFATAMTIAATTTSTGSGNPSSAIMTNIWYK
jgi:hypothetical protein